MSKVTMTMARLAALTMPRIGAPHAVRSRCASMPSLSAAPQCIRLASTSSPSSADLIANSLMKNATSATTAPTSSHVESAPATPTTAIIPGAPGLPTSADRRHSHEGSASALAEFTRANEVSKAASVVAERHAQAASLLAQLARSLPAMLDAERATRLNEAADAFARCAHAMSLATQSSHQAAHAQLPSKKQVAPKLKSVDFAATRQAHVEAVRALERAWAPVVGTVARLSDVRAMSQVLDQVHAAILGAGLVLEEEFLQGTKGTAIDPSKLAAEAIAEARAWAEKTYGWAPAVELTVTSAAECAAQATGQAVPKAKLAAAPLLVAHSPRHISDLMVAALRSSLTAVAEAKVENPAMDAAPVRMLVVDGREDLAVKISDAAPGMSQSQLRNLFGYGLIAHREHPRLPPLPYSQPHGPVAKEAADRRPAGSLLSYASSLMARFRQIAVGPSEAASKNAPVAAAAIQAPEQPAQSPPVESAKGEPNPNRVPPPSCRVLMQHSVPLSLARVHARYFGGDLEVVSMENLGTDTYLHLAKPSI